MSISLADAVISLLNNPERQDRLAKEGYKNGHKNFNIADLSMNWILFITY